MKKQEPIQPSWVNEVRDRLRIVREIRSMTLKELGEAIELSHATVGRIETPQDGGSPNLDTVTKLCEGLGVSPYAVLGSRTGFRQLVATLISIRLEEVGGQEQTFMGREGPEIIVTSGGSIS